LTAGLIVAISGAASALFVVTANAWMNTPTGFRLQDGQVVDIHPLAAMLNPASGPESLHMLLAAYAATGLAVAAIHALLLLRAPNDRFHQRALTVALLVGAPAAVLQPISGDISGEHVARWQPAKLAAMEGDFRTEKGAGLRVGGVPDERLAETRYAIVIPYGLSLLAFHDPHALVKGLDAFPRDQWPPVAPVHLAFDVMVGLGSYMAGVALWALIVMVRRGEPARHPMLLRALVTAGPMGFIAIEAGWTVTEVGRQPWIVYGVLRTADAVTPMPGLIVPFVTFTTLYGMLGVIVVSLLRHLVLTTAGTTQSEGGDASQAAAIESASVAAP
jgi:cytochrome bd ubiquinol oxidase subunit I